MQRSYEVVFYQTPRGDVPVDEFLDALDKKVRAKALKWLTLLGEEGPNLPMPYADVVEGPIRELRIGFGHLELRFLYFFYRKKIVVTRGFLKKSRAIDPAEVQRALRAYANWIKRQGGIRHEEEI